jgi:hypothetical protein
MKLKRRFTLVSLAAVNLLVAVMLLVELWGFYHDLDRPGFLRNAADEHKTAMLRNLHYWGIPPIAFLTMVSGVWLWRLGREEEQ